MPAMLRASLTRWMAVAAGVALGGVASCAEGTAPVVETPEAAQGMWGQFSFSDRVGRELSFTIDGATESVNLFTGDLSLSVPVVRLDGDWLSLDYQPHGFSTPVWDSGVSHAWSETLFGGLYDFRDTGDQLTWAGLPHPGVWLMTPDGAVEKTAERTVDGAPSLWTPSFKRVRKVGATYEQLNPDGRKVLYAATMDLEEFHSLGGFDHTTFYLPTQIDDPDGSRLSISYYDGSPIPRVVTKWRRGPAGLTEVARAYYYLERQVDSSASPTTPPTAYGDVKRTDHISVIRYPGVDSADQLTPQADWATTRLNYSTVVDFTNNVTYDKKQIWLLEDVTVNGERYEFDYTSDAPGVSGFEYKKHFLKEVRLPNKAVLNYPGSGVTRWRTLKDPDRQLARWTFDWEYIDGIYGDPPADIFGAGLHEMYLVKVMFPDETGTPAYREDYYFYTVSSLNDGEEHDLIDPRYGKLIRHTRFPDPAPWPNNRPTGYETEYYGYAVYTFGKKDPTGQHTSCEASIALPSFTAKTNIQKGSDGVVTGRHSVVTLYRDQALATDHTLEPFGAGERRDYDEYGNRPFEQTFVTDQPISFVNPGNTDVGWMGEGTNPHSACFSHDAAEPDLPALNHSANLDAVNASVVVPAGAEQTRTSWTYWYEVSGNADAYLAKNLTGLVREQVTTHGDVEIARTRFDYDHEFEGYPAPASTPGTADLGARGWPTFVGEVDLDTGELGKASYRRYQGDDAYGFGQVVETATLADTAIVAGETVPRYRRTRSSYAPLAQGTALPASPTEVAEIDYGGGVHVVSQTAYNAWALPIWSRDENGAESRMQHDAKGRRTHVFGPLDGATASNETIYDDSVYPRKVTEIRRGEQAFTSATFFDALGREVQTQVGADTAIVRSTAYYAHTSRVIRRSLPSIYTFGHQVGTYVHLPPTSREHERYVYDGMGRLAEFQHVDSSGAIQRKTTARFGERDPSVPLASIRFTDANGKQLRRDFDLWGRQTRQVLPGGDEVAFEYNDRGQLETVVQPDGLVATNLYDGLGRPTGNARPEAGEQTLAYNYAGELVRGVDAEGRTVTMDYDYRGRVLSKRGTAGAEVNTYAFSYDSYALGAGISNDDFVAGRLASVTQTIGATTVSREVYGYDALGRTIETAITSGGLPTKTVLSELDAANTLHRTRYQPGASDGYELRYTHDSAGRPIGVGDVRADGTVRPIEGWRYTLSGNLDQRNLMPRPPGQGQLYQLSYRYGSFDRLTGVNNVHASNELFAYELGYESGGALDGATARRDGIPAWVKWRTGAATAPAAYVFEYDARDRLVGADYREYHACPGNPGDPGEPGDPAEAAQLGGAMAVIDDPGDPDCDPWEDRFAYDVVAGYDQMGNLTGLAQRPSEETPAAAISYTYAATTRRLQSVSGGVSASFGYDDAGNLRSDSRLGAGVAYTYNGFGKIRSVEDSALGRKLEFVYDADGARIREIERRKDAAGVYQVVSDLITITVDGAPIAQYTAAGALRQHHYGDSIVRIPAGSPVGRAGLTFLLKDHVGATRVLLHESGQVLDVRDYFPFGQEIAARTQTAETFASPQRYAGLARDEQMGHAIDFGTRARSYDPQLGRFLQVDPRAADPSLVAMSGYVYSGNIPTAFNDADGEIWNFVIAGVVGGLVEAGTQLVMNGGDFRQLNWTQIGIAAIKEGATGGAGKLWSVAWNVAESVAKQVTDLDENGNYKGWSNVSFTKTLTDTIGSAIPGAVDWQRGFNNVFEVGATSRAANFARRFGTDGWANRVAKHERDAAVAKYSAVASANFASEIVESAAQNSLDLARRTMADLGEKLRSPLADVAPMKQAPAADYTYNGGTLEQAVVSARRATEQPKPGKTISYMEAFYGPDPSKWPKATIGTMKFKGVKAFGVGE
jgi:RHS repeat-associated protein